jgi:hypothetical protein
MPNRTIGIQRASVDVRNTDDRRSSFVEVADSSRFERFVLEPGERRTVALRPRELSKLTLGEGTVIEP